MAHTPFTGNELCIYQKHHLEIEIWNFRTGMNLHKKNSMFLRSNFNLEGNATNFPLRTISFALVLTFIF